MTQYYENTCNQLKRYSLKTNSDKINGRGERAILLWKSLKKMPQGNIIFTLKCPKRAHMNKRVIYNL